MASIQPLHQERCVSTTWTYFEWLVNTQWLRHCYQVAGLDSWCWAWDCWDMSGIRSGPGRVIIYKFRSRVPTPVPTQILLISNYSQVLFWELLHTQLEPKLSYRYQGCMFLSVATHFKLTLKHQYKVALQWGGISIINVISCEQNFSKPKKK